MPTLKAPKAEPATLYRALTSFVYASRATGMDATVQEGTRLRGDHEAVKAYPHFFIAADTDDPTLKAAQQALGKDTHR